MTVRDTLLLACGTPDNRKVLRSLFENSFNLLEADTSHQARLLLDQNNGCIAVVILDITVPSKIDEAVLKGLEKTTLLKEIPIVIITNNTSPAAQLSIFESGATDVFSIHSDPYVLQHRIHNMVELCRNKWHLEELVEEQAAILRHSNDAMVDALSSIIEYRSVESGQHILRIRRFTQILLEEIARTCPEYELTDDTIRIISSASALHDVGKISIPDSILNKPGKLTAEEWEVMKGHAVTGCRILESLSDVGNQDYLRYALNIAHYHHERWDGSGYPEGLSGDNIPICAQVVGLADAYDALTTKRVYKDAFSYKQAVNMILNGECGSFSPKLLECFKQVEGKFKALAKSYADGRSPNAENFDTTLPCPIQQESQNTLQVLQEKYQSLLHYANATVIEVDLDQETYHLVYNPDPNLVMLQQNTSFQELQQAIIDHILLPQERESFLKMLYKDIPAFLEDGLHRQTHSFLAKSRSSSTPVTYEVTILRVDPNDLERRRLIVIWQQSDKSAIPLLTPPASRDTSVLGQITKSFCCRNDTHFTLVHSMEPFSELAGYSLEELEQCFQNHLDQLVFPEDRSVLRQRFNEQLALGNEVELTFRVLHKGGHVLWVLNKSRLVLEQDGNEYLYSILTDITRAKEAQNNYDLTLEQYQLILSQVGNIVFEWDLTNDSMVVSNTWNEIFGYAPLTEKVSTRISTHSHFHPDDIPLFFEWLHDIQCGKAHLLELRIANTEGRYLWCRFRAAASFASDGTPLRILGIIINIDAEKQATQELQQQAQRDSLTKLLNKQTARKQAEEYLDSVKGGAHCALMIIDLDNFKTINDRFGHMFGDAILTQAANEIKRLFRSQDIVARIGGDEFMVLMRGTSDVGLVEQRCGRLVEVFAQIARRQLPDSSLSCSVGVALSPEHGTTYYDLFQHADQALYQAKEFGKNRYVFYNNLDHSYQMLRNSVPTATTAIDSEEHPDLSNSGIVQYTFQRLYDSTDLDASVNDVLELVGRQMNVSRVYIFENSADNKTCSNTFEWCNDGVPPEIENLQNISYETDIPNFENNYNEDGIFYCPDILSLPQNLKDILEPQGIKSMLHCAIRDNGVFRGYIGFDECFENRLWTKEQIQILRILSEMLSVFLLKKRAQEETARRLNDLTSILDNQTAWIYVIDPDTCELRFLNAKTKEIAPHAKEGMLCYKALMGQSERCADCPALNIRQSKNRTLSIINSYLDLQVQADATLIRWGGEEACLLTCRELCQEFPQRP